MLREAKYKTKVDPTSKSQRSALAAGAREKKGCAHSH